MLKQKTFNYLTLILAIITIFMVVSAVKNGDKKWPCVCMLVITLCFNYVSRRYNDEIINLKRKDKEFLNEIDEKIKEKKKKQTNKNK